MQVTAAEEFRAIPWMFLCGVICGMMYDIVSIVRLWMGLASFSWLLPHGTRKKTAEAAAQAGITEEKTFGCLKSLGLALGDIVFSLLAAGTFSVFLSHALYGIFRWFCLLASAAGFLLYRVTFGKAVLCLAECLLVIFHRLIRCFIHLLLFPLRLVLKFGRFLCRIISVRWLTPLQRWYLIRRRSAYTRKKLIHLRTDIMLS